MEIERSHQLKKLMNKYDIAIVDICQKHPDKAIILPFTKDDKESSLEKAREFCRNHPDDLIYRAKNDKLVVFTSDIWWLIDEIVSWVKSYPDILEALSEPVITTSYYNNNIRYFPEDGYDDNGVWGMGYGGQHASKKKRMGPNHLGGSGLPAESDLDGYRQGDWGGCGD